MPRRRRATTTLSALVVAAALARPARGEIGAPSEVRLALPESGAVGAWLVAGPFAARPGASPLETAPAGLADDAALVPTRDAPLGGARDLAGKTRPPARWTLVAAGGKGQDPGHEGARSVDLRAALDDAGGKELVAYAGGRLHVAAAGRFLLLLGVDDGVRVTVDGKVVFQRDVPRPLRDDDDLVPLDLAAGDHDLVLKLHQRDGGWGFRAKLVDDTLAPPRGAAFVLPGTTADDARALAASLSWLVVERTFAAGRYLPTVTVRYPDGAPLGVPLPVAARVAGPDGFELQAGAVAVGETGVRDLRVVLPPLAPAATPRALELTVAGRLVVSSLAPRPEAERALARSEKALAATAPHAAWLLPGSLDSVRYLADRLARLVARGDGDAEALAEEAKELDTLAAGLEAGRDPYEGRTGPMRRALVTPYDDAPSELGLYVPPGYRRGDGKRWPLVVGLHGLNSYPMSLLRALFGLDDEKREAAWKDRHPVPLPAVDAFVLTPHAHGNAMYREIGEDDVLHALRWVTSLYPIDDTRITITGPSMGGIGAAALPLHFPGIFAAAEPLCGYHSYLIRPEILARPRRPWEQAELEERSNVFWAENGEHLPLYIAHGTRDLPEANSGVLIEAYEKLGYSVKHEHPDVGHNVWGPTWGELKGMKWLLDRRLDPHPAHVRFKTLRGRYATSGWVTIDALARELAWGEVDARIAARDRIEARTQGITGVRFARDAKRLGEGAVTVVLDGTSLRYDAGEPLVAHRDGRRWDKGAAAPAGLRKGGHVTGPLRDVFHEPLTFVYAADREARANEKVARFFAERPGIPTGYRVLSDAEFLARGEPLANDRALFLVGRNNKVLAGLGALPIRVEDGAVTVGATRHEGAQLGAAFVYPNPLRPDRYVVVVAGADVVGTLRAMALPDLLPDYLVWDERIAAARGQLVLGGTPIRAGGLFGNDWSLP